MDLYVGGVNPRVAQESACPLCLLGVLALYLIEIPYIYACIPLS